MNVVAEIGEQDVLPEMLERLPGVTGQPVTDYIFFCFHSYYELINAAAICKWRKLIKNTFGAHAAIEFRPATIQTPPY